MAADLRNARRFDLHMHSDQSDGKWSVDEVIRRAAISGLDVVALTDHDLSPTVDPKDYVIDGHRVRLLAGAEVTGVHEGREYHLLVYFPGDVPQGFHDFCRGQTRGRADRYATAVRNLGLEGLQPPSAEAQRGDRALTRHHLARELVRAGHAESLADAFARFVGGAHGRVPNIGTPFVDAIRIARGFGGVTSWAHPPLPALRAYLPTFVAAGLQGVEGLRPMQSSSTRKAVRKLARKHGLFLTGGSDWHGWTDAELGLFSAQRSQLQGFLDALAA